MHDIEGTGHARSDTCMDIESSNHARYDTCILKALVMQDMINAWL